MARCSTPNHSYFVCSTQTAVDGALVQTATGQLAKFLSERDKKQVKTDAHGFEATFLNKSVTAARAETESWRHSTPPARVKAEYKKEVDAARAYAAKGEGQGGSFKIAINLCTEYETLIKALEDEVKKAGKGGTGQPRTI